MLETSCVYRRIVASRPDCVTRGTPSRARCPSAVRALLPLALALSLVASERDAHAASICRECVLRPLRARTAALTRCYRQLLERMPGAQGRVVVRFVIPTDGRVRDVAVTQAPFGDGEFRRCLESRIRGLTYREPPPAPMTIHYPLVFRER